MVSRTACRRNLREGDFVGLYPIERILADGCRLDLDVEATVRGQPVDRVEVERFEIDKIPKTHGTMYRGSAVK